MEKYIRTFSDYIYRYDGQFKKVFKILTPNINYSVRTAPLNSKFPIYIFIQQI